MDPFQTLGIERRFDVDLKAVEKRHRDLSRELHPDRHLADPPDQRAQMLSRAVEVNEAWRTVRDPVKRAEALFRAAGLTVGDAAEPRPTPALLMEMMERREELEEAKLSGDAGRVRRLAEVVEAREAAARASLAHAFAGPSSALGSHLHLLGELRFYRRFLDEVSEIEDRQADG